MSYNYRRTYRGPIEAVILDWAGTTLDFGCVAPAVVFVEVFRRQGVAIDMAEARGPMGAGKRDHIATITALDAVQARWHAVHGRKPAEADIDAMYADFIPLQLQCLSEYSDLIPGTLEAAAEMRRRGIKLGSTSGYDRAMMAVNAADAKRQGFEVDAIFCSTDVKRGRPFPFMALQNVIALGVSHVEACVKVDDTVPGIEEGLNAGMWTIGFSISGNEVGLSLAEWATTAPAEQERLRARAANKLLQSGAHYVVDSIAGLMPCLDDIAARLARGDKP
jgi:phosphonoacetaldehyde hydrolase